MLDTQLIFTAVCSRSAQRNVITVPSLPGGSHCACVITFQTVIGNACDNDQIHSHWWRVTKCIWTSTVLVL